MTRSDSGCSATERCGSTPEGKHGHADRDGEIAEHSTADARVIRNGPQGVVGIRERQHIRGDLEGRAIPERSAIKPHNKNCGSTNAGMNWIAWNSVLAKALRASPIDIPNIALAIATTMAS